VNGSTVRIGFVLTLMAVIMFSLSALFLDYYRGPPSFPDPGITYYDVLTRRAGGSTHTAATIGGTIIAFGGPAIIAVLAISGIVGRRDPPVRSSAGAAVAVWCTLIVGSALTIWGSREDIPVGPGFWTQAACAGIAIVGALLLSIPNAGTSPTERHPE
jgi:hypothetical protein